MDLYVLYVLVCTAFQYEYICHRLFTRAILGTFYKLCYRQRPPLSALEGGNPRSNNQEHQVWSCSEMSLLGASQRIFYLTNSFSSCHQSMECTLINPLLCSLKTNEIFALLCHVWNSDIYFLLNVIYCFIIIQELYLSIVFWMIARYPQNCF